MIELRRERDFPEESLDHHRAAELGTKHLDRYLAAVSRIRAEVDSSHSPAADFSLYLVSVSDLIEADVATRRRPLRGHSGNSSRKGMKLCGVGFRMT